MEIFKFLHVVEVHLEKDNQGRITCFKTYHLEDDCEVIDLPEEKRLRIAKLECDYSKQTGQIIDNYSGETYDHGQSNLVVLHHETGYTDAGPQDVWARLKYAQHLEYLIRLYCRDVFKMYKEQYPETWEEKETILSELTELLKNIEDAVEQVTEMRKDGLEPMENDLYLAYWALSKIASGNDDKTILNTFDTNIPKAMDDMEEYEDIITILTNGKVVLPE